MKTFLKQRLLLATVLAVLTAGSAPLRAQSDSAQAPAKGDLNFLIANDTGRNGRYDQKTIAETMGQTADEVGAECVFAVGDVHHFGGVRSTSDPLWMTNYELIYSHPELMVDWYPVLGNHEYRGNTQAVLDYSQVSRRWSMPGRYYTKTFAGDSTTLRVVMLDTTPLIDRYRQDNTVYPDAGAQDMERELQWADSVLASATEDWVVVMGHHPIYADTGKDTAERADMQRRLDPILRRHKVDAYISGHIHNFQHIRRPDCDIDYVVNSAGALSRKVAPTDGTMFCSPATGFAVMTADKRHLCIHMVDAQGKTLHTVTRSK